MTFAQIAAAVTDHTSEGVITALGATIAGLVAAFWKWVGERFTKLEQGIVTLTAHVETKIADVEVRADERHVRLFDVMTSQHNQIVASTTPIHTRLAVLEEKVGQINAKPNPAPPLAVAQRRKRK